MALPPLGAPQWASLGLIVLSLGLLSFMAVATSFYVYSDAVTVTGNHYVSRDAVYQAAGVDAYHILFLNPSDVARRVEQLPHVRQARVWFGLPATVHVQVQERQPLFVWQRGGTTSWVDAEGVIMPAVADLSDGPRLVDPDGAALVTDADGQEQINPYLLAAMRQLITLTPEARAVYYDRANGLRLILGDTHVILGTGSGLTRRIAYFRLLLDGLAEKGEHYTWIDMREPERPVLRP